MKYYIIFNKNFMLILIIINKWQKKKERKKERKNYPISPYKNFTASSAKIKKESLILRFIFLKNK